MLRPQNLLLLLCTSLDWVTVVVGVIRVFGYEGGDVTVSCPYGAGYESYEKYLCKNDCGDSDVLIRTGEKVNGRFSISDNKSARIFAVTISALSSSDPLKYWCGVTKTGKDIYTEVKLHIRPDSCCDDVVPVQSHEHLSVSISCPYEAKHKDQMKYVCRGGRPSVCLEQAVVTSEETPHGRFRLTDDNAGEFRVAIAGLTKGDAGQYLCGVRMASGLDVFTAVQLEIQKWCCVTDAPVTGDEGQPVTLRCPYPPEHRDNRKFLCKGDHRSHCTDTVTLGSRFTLQDDVASGSFVVIIAQLRADDAGTYWCGSDSQWNAGNYTRIQLSVSLQLTTIAISTFTVEATSQNSTEMLRSFSHGVLLIVGISMLTVLLIVLITIVVVYKCKRRKRHGSKVIKSTRAVGEEMNRPDLYTNQDFIMRAQGKTPKQQSACRHDDEDEDQPDYENLAMPDELYCNGNFHR